MLESFFATHDYLVSQVAVPLRRLMEEVDWSNRLIAICGGRGVGKTDFLLNYARRYKDENPDLPRSILYVNFNNFYFAKYSLVDFAEEFVQAGGKVLLLDQAFKYPNWSREIRECYVKFRKLHIVFTASPLMRLQEGNPDIGHIVTIYHLRGYSFREFVNLRTGSSFLPLTINQIFSHHEEIARSVCTKIKPLFYFHEYLRQGYYPYREVGRDFSETLLKTMNMILEVDVLIIKQIDVAYLSKLRRLLFYLLQKAPCSLNISDIATEIDTSRATIMNYLKFLTEAQMLNLLYAEDKQFPMKPTRVYLHNPNLCYALPMGEVDQQALIETFFYSAMTSKHHLCAAENASFIIDKNTKIDILVNEPTKPSFRYTAVHNLEIGKEKIIPAWLFGFLD